MARRKKSGKQKIKSEAPPKPVGFETVLGPGASITGHLSSKSSVRLDGSFEGTLEVGGNILVGEAGKIIADLNARYIAIAGAVRGNVTGERVRILRTGRVWGDIRAHSISAEEGAFIQGQMTTVPEGEPLVPPTPQEPLAESVRPEPAVEREPEPVAERGPEQPQEEPQVYFPEPEGEGEPGPEPVEYEAEAPVEAESYVEPSYQVDDEGYVTEAGDLYPEDGGELAQPEPPSDGDEDEIAPVEDEQSPAP